MFLQNFPKIAFCDVFASGASSTCKCPYPSHVCWHPGRLKIVTKTPWSGPLHGNVMPTDKGQRERYQSLWWQTSCSAGVFRDYERKIIGTVRETQCWIPCRAEHIFRILVQFRPALNTYERVSRSRIVLFLLYISSAAPDEMGLTGTLGKSPHFLLASTFIRANPSYCGRKESLSECVAIKVVPGSQMHNWPRICVRLYYVAFETADEQHWNFIPSSLNLHGEMCLFH